MTWRDWRNRIRGAAVAAWAWRVRVLTRRRIVWAAAGGVSALLLGVSAEAFLRAHIPDPAARAPSALYTRPTAWNGAERASLAIGTLDGGAVEWRMPVRLAELPDHLVAAVLAVEDQRFHDHFGLDLRRIGGAMMANLRAGGISQGGSTITQQLAKNLFLTHDRTPIRKLREAALALALEARHSKDEILEAYLNEIYLGQDRGAAIHGVGAAARFYFNKDARRLVVSEAATLAAMIPAPNRLSPQRRPEDVRARRNMVLGLMAEQGRISGRTRDQSSRVTVPTRTYPQRTIEGRWFRDLAQSSVPRGLPRRGAAVHTTLDAGLQLAAEEAIRHGLAWSGSGSAQAALVVLDPRTGEVLALVGGRDYAGSQFNRAVQARRQPGSAFKPFVALAALEPRGNRPPAFTLASQVPDEPLAVRSGGELWQPANFDGTFRGEVTLRYALEQSLNVPFARIGMDIGHDRIAATGRRLGIRSPLRPVPALALGASEVSLLELTRAYGVLAAGGRLAETRTIAEVRQAGVRLEPAARVEPEQVVEPATAFLVTSALEGVIERGTGRGLQRTGVAGKTGTSNGYRDAWFVAYTPDLVVGVWVGHDDGTSLRRTGGAAAVPIAARFFEQARVRSRGFAVPDGVVQARTRGDGWFTSCGEPEYFLEGTAPRGEFCWDVNLDRVGDWFRGIGGRDPGRDDDRDRDPRRRREQRDAIRRAEEWLRNQGQGEVERLLESVERGLSRIRLR